MSRYDPLYRWLSAQPYQHVTLTLSATERILSSPLPPSAWSYSAWWANEVPGSSRHVQCQAWMSAGWHAYPRLASGEVVFAKVLQK